MGLDERFANAVREELAVPGTRAPPFPLRLPPAIRETLKLFGPDTQAESYYCDRMPRMLVEQMLRGDDPARRLLWRPVPHARLSQALRGLEHVLAQEQLSFESLTGAASAARLLEQRPTIAALSAPTLLGSGLPLVGAWPGELELINAELAAGADPGGVLDLRLSGGVMHELCHGLSRELHGPPPPWMVLEAAALYLGALAFPRHVFPEIAGEAVPGVSLFVMVGQCLARLFGRRALFRLVVEGGPLFAAEKLEAAARRDWEARREVPFARDALNALDWIRLADDGRWVDEPVTSEDVEILRTGIRAMFQVNVLAPTYQTHPCEPAAIRLDPASCTLTRPRDECGVFGEPAFWMAPPNICRKLRGPLTVERPRRADIEGLVDRWTSSS